jgi:hypothetical protein
MDTFALPAADCVLPKVTALARMPLAEFVARWRALTGEPPAVMLDDRSRMLVLLVKGIPAAPFLPAAQIGPSDHAPRNAGPDAQSFSELPSNILKFRCPGGRSTAT